MSEPRFFKNDDFEFMVQLMLGAAYFRAADPGQLFAACERIKDGDYGSWCSEWEATAAGAEDEARESEGAGRRVSAREAFMRASTYWFAAVFFISGTKRPERIDDLWRRHRDCAERALRLLHPPAERIAIPYEDVELEGWVFRPAGSEGAKLPILILNNGSDGTLTDMWVQGAASAIERGWAAMTFDGPGQGRALYDAGLGFRPDWEHVVTPVVESLLARDDVDPDRIAILGVSQGGYWVPRAIAFEHRIAAAVADPGVVDVSEAMLSASPKSARKLLDEGEKEKFDKEVGWAERFSKSMRWLMKFRAMPYGTESAYEMFKRAMEHRLDEETIKRIRCPVLVTDPEGEQFWPGQSQRLFDSLEAPGKEIVRFTAAEGAELHCEPRSPAIRTQRIFDWLETTLAP